MDRFFEQLGTRAATIDELLSDDFESLPGQNAETNIASQRLAAWCRSCASGDWLLFSRRLERDNLSLDRILPRLATARRRPSAVTPSWVADAEWIDAAFAMPAQNAAFIDPTNYGETFPFELLFASVAEHSEQRLWSGIECTGESLSAAARMGLRRELVRQLSKLCTPIIYERFVISMKSASRSELASGSTASQSDIGTSLYDQFVGEMRDGGLRKLFEEKPVLLRLIATTTRQWIDTTRELIGRLDADLNEIRRDILRGAADSRVADIEGNLSDLHNSGRSVQVIVFDDGCRILYKPKDLQLDAQWAVLVERLNRAHPPIDLRAARVISRDGYGWSEFIDHTQCVDRRGFECFFRRAGAWLALFHVFTGTDMNKENIIAAGEQPVPIDLEMMLQASEPENQSDIPENRAFELALGKITSSVLMVGLLPAYGRSRENKVIELGGLNGQQRTVMERQWVNINTNAMRPARTTRTSGRLKNTPWCANEYAKLGDYVDNVVEGFKAYAKFLLHMRRVNGQLHLFDGFTGLPVRKVVRPTRFYNMLIERLKDQRHMGDGVIWSAQLDFMSRLANWERNNDPIWPLLRAERCALVTLNIPHFVSPSDKDAISDATGTSIHTGAEPGLNRARARFEQLDDAEIDWQIEVIRASTNGVPRSGGPMQRRSTAFDIMHSGARIEMDTDFLVGHAGAIVQALSNSAIRDGNGAAWIGLDCLDDSDVYQLVPVGAGLYSGALGISVFLAAYARLRDCQDARQLALASIVCLRHSLRSQNAARLARSLGIGGGSGLGSVVYGLTLLSKLMHCEDLLRDAQVAAQLISNDLISADKQFDIMDGSAGGILGLLSLYQVRRELDVLERATRCGEHLLGARRLGSDGMRSWIGQGHGQKPLNGMSHGAAGFAYALASLAAATGCEDFAAAARECITFENASYAVDRGNWPDYRGQLEGADISWPCQWCHGAAGIGLARIATLRVGGTMNARALRLDVEKALNSVEQNWPNAVDTLCCGTLGNIEFLSEAGAELDMPGLRHLASRRLQEVITAAEYRGDYRWAVSDRRFNLGLFRGLAGVGYTMLRMADSSLPNVLIWE